MAIVASTLLKKAIIPPIVSDWAIKKGYRSSNGTGTSFSLFKGFASEFGLEYGGTLSAKTTATFQTIKEWCDNGGLAIINAYSASPYTTSGHYIVCYKVDNNVVYIQDCNYSNRNLGNYTVSQWISGSGNGWFGSIALIKAK